MASERMDPKTLAALDASIAAWHRKWEMAATDEGMGSLDLGSESCPLCLLFNRAVVQPGGRCCGCPVDNAVGSDFCIRTPYVEAAAARRAFDVLRYQIPVEPLVDLEIARGAFRAAASRDGIVGSGV